jgi:hypothetical protein
LDLLYIIISVEWSLMRHSILYLQLSLLYEAWCIVISVFRCINDFSSNVVIHGWFWFLFLNAFFFKLWIRFKFKKKYYYIFCMWHFPTVYGSRIFKNLTDLYLDLYLFPGNLAFKWTWTQECESLSIIDYVTPWKRAFNIPNVMSMLDLMIE